MPRKLCNFRADETLIAAAKARAAGQGVTLTWVIERALGAYAAGKWQPPAGTPEATAQRLDGLEDAVDGIARRVGKLESRMGEAYG